MKLATFATTRPAHGSGWSSTTTMSIAFPAPMTMRDDHRPRARSHCAAGPATPAPATACRCPTVRLLAPLAPASVRDFVAFEEHVEGVRRSIDGVAGVPEAWYDAPTFYFTNPHTIIGPGRRRSRSRAAASARDFELEVAVVVGRDGRSLTCRAGQRRTSSATRSSTTGRPATCSAARCRSASGRPRARTSPSTLGPVDRHRRRARAVPRRGRLPRPVVHGGGQRHRDRPRPAVQHGLDLRDA